MSIIHAGIDEILYLVNRDLLTSQGFMLFFLRQRVLRRNVLALTCGCSTLFEHPTCETGVFSKIETTLLTVQDRKKYASIMIWFELMFSHLPRRCFLLDASF